MRVPVLNSQGKTGISGQSLRSYQEVIDSGQFIMGDEVASIEEQIAEMAGASYGIGVGNCSDALHLCVQACGIGPGDEVITTPFTFFATAGAVARHGATPVFVDIDLETYNMPRGHKNAITPALRPLP